MKALGGSNPPSSAVVTAHDIIDIQSCAEVLLCKRPGGLRTLVDFSLRVDAMMPKDFAGLEFHRGYDGGN